MDSSTVILMPPDVAKLWARVNPWELYPPFLWLVNKGLQALLRQGEEFYCTQAVRSYEYQAKLYAYGRTDKSRGIVTKAPPGRSVHNFYGAADLVYDEDDDKEGLQPSWKKAHFPKYKVMADAMTAVGLEAGYYWKNLFDAPHIQLPLGKHGLNVLALRRAYEKGGRDRVFKLLDQYQWVP